MSSPEPQEDAAALEAREAGEVEARKARGPLAWMAQNAVASNVLMVLLIAGGLAMLFTGIKQEVFPEIELDLVLVNVPYPGASPEEVEQGVILALEEAVLGLDGVKEIRSTANEGMGVVAIELLLGTDSDRALADVKSAVDRITSFPQDIERPVVALATNRRQVISLVIHGEREEQQLRGIAEDVRRRLLDDPNITFVDIAGTRPLEIGIEVPQEALREHGLTLDGIAQTIRQASVDVPAGAIKTRSGEVLLRTTERRDRGSEFGEIVLRGMPDGSLLRVRDVARIEDGFREVDQASLFNGEPAVLVNAYRVGDETPITIAESVFEHLRRIEPTLPDGVGIAVWNDASEIYADRISLLERNALIGLVLVILVLGLFLEPRLAFWVTLGIPISFAGSLLFLPMADVSINMISLFAFIVTLGMVVDDAIVVGEAIHHHRASGKGYLAAAIDGVREVARPVVFAILTSCVAFAPLLFVPGMMGKFFRVIPIVVIAVLLISLLESLFVLPAHLSHPMPRWLQIFTWPILKPISWLQPKTVGRWLEIFVLKVYKPSLSLALRWRYVTLAVGAATFLITVGLVVGGRVGFTFMPKIEGDIVRARLRMPVGTSIEETRRHHDRIREALEETLAELSEGQDVVRGVFSELGVHSAMSGHAAMGGTPTGAHLTSVVVYLVQSDQRPFGATELARRWRDRVGDIPGAEALSYRFEIGASGGEPINIRLSHDDPEALEAAAERLAEEIRAYAGVRDIDSGVASGKEQLDFRLRPEGRARGLSESEMARQLRSAFYGSEALRQQRGRDEIRVYVRSPLAERQSLGALHHLILRTPMGGEMSLAQAAEIHRGRAYTTIRRTDGRRVVSVTGDIVAGQANANEVVSTLEARELPALLADFPGLTYSMGGQQQQQAESLKSLGLGFILALLTMLAILAVAFRSYAQPLLVMSAIPFGIVGAIWGHLIMGFDLSIMSAMGIVALGGVVVNDSLILIDTINELRKRGVSAYDAVIQGGMRRFRPILLTSLTTFFGLAPMILEPSVQARFLIPMAISLGFGVLFATFIMLIIVPALVCILEDLSLGDDPEEAPGGAQAAPAE